MDSDQIIKHYQGLLSKHGVSPKAIQYADTQTQFKRFSVLADVAPELTSVLDVGCGLADFYHYLRSVKQEGYYLGVDIVPEFIKIAQDATAESPNATAKLIEPGAALPTGFDYAILSGVFNNKMDNNWFFMTNMLRNMYDSVNTAIAFNAMTTYVDYQDKNLYYVDPMQVFAYCKTELGGYPILRHDYTVREGGFPFEFAMYVYKTPNF